MISRARIREAMKYPCPVCHAKPHERCLSLTDPQVRPVRVPHPRRLALAELSAEDRARTLPEPSITCPVCGMTSYHPDDIRAGYCGNCHDWTRGTVTP
jgi:hypothetical protein